MEFRHPVVAAKHNAESGEYLTKDLSDPEAGRTQFNELLEELGNTIDGYPDWHPIATALARSADPRVASMRSLEDHEGVDHTVRFVRGFVTCPYSEDAANQLVDLVKTSTSGLHAYRLQAPLYSDHTHPVVVVAYEVQLQADGTIHSRDALRWYTEQLVKNARDAEVAETWWNIRTEILGYPHGSRSSLLVDQYTGGHMRKILEALNNSGIYGPIKERSLDMLSEKKRKQISETLIRAAVDNRKNNAEEFEFELRGETCKASIRDTWEDGDELSVRVTIGNNDLVASGFYYGDKKHFEVIDPRGKRHLAQKFL